jgi:radical SAM superfamily enzyme YgiQ (UPF0313 family)
MKRLNVVVSNPPWPGEGYGARTNVRWPHRRGDKKLAFPIYLAYTNAILKKLGFKSYGIDAVEKELDIPRFITLLKKIKPDVIILEISTPSLEFDLETAKDIKKNLNTFTAVCGPHATYFHRELIRDHSFIDACIRGEFEYTIKDLCLALEQKNPLNKILGLTFRENNKIIINKDRPLIKDLDELPPPDREDFKIENYQQAFYCGKKTALIVSSKGCPYRCSFCLWPGTIGGHEFRARSAKNVVDEIEDLIKNKKIDSVFFDDDLFALNKERVKDICKEFLKRKIEIPWLCMGRVNTMDEDTLKIMKEAGCTQVFYGFESGSEKILKSISKGITKEQMIKAVKLTQKAGLVASGSFIFGLPLEDKKTAKETIHFAKRLGADFVQFALAAPFPGTRFYEEAKKKNLLQIGSWSDFDGTKGPIVKTEFLSKDDLKGILRKAYISYYTSPRVILNNLKKLRSLEDLRRILTGVRSVLSRIIYYKE